jgi:NAD(P)-dependent dehydrogenase (short-subunit alcohol dehydrogenase family)
MKKRVMLLTGASGGMGSALVHYFAEREYQLVLQYHTDKEDLEKLLHSLNPTYEPQLYQADLRSEEAIVHLCGEAQKIYGTVDVLINNAGLSASSMIWKQPLDQWNDLLQVNLTAPFLMIKHLAPSMRYHHYGRIINISSVVAQLGAVGTSAYAASKSALFGLTKSAALELAPKGITVNTIALGYMQAGMIHELSEDRVKDIVSGIPMGSLGNPKSLAAMIEFLASEEAGYVTGQILNLNGGMYG